MLTYSGIFNAWCFMARYEQALWWDTFKMFALSEGIQKNFIFGLHTWKATQDLPMQRRTFIAIFLFLLSANWNYI